MKTVNDIRRQLIQKYRDGDFVTDKTGQKTVEIVAESFIANEDWIVKLPNKEYIERELEWYKSQSLFVKDIPGETPAIWKQVADADGKINVQAEPDLKLGYLAGADAFTGKVQIKDTSSDNVLAEMNATNLYDTTGLYVGTVLNFALPALV